VVVGIGINVHQGVEFFEAQPMDAPATSLDIESGRRTDRNEFVRTLLEQLEYWLDQTAWAKPTLQETGGMNKVHPAKVVEEWKRRNRQIGTRLSLESDGQIYCGTCLGIDPAEGLIVQLDRGPIRIFSAASTTLIKNPAQD
jgi:biotin-(acetyl-CoA carboxylase) ligase